MRAKTLLLLLGACAIMGAQGAAARPAPGSADSGTVFVLAAKPGAAAMHVDLKLTHVATDGGATVAVVALSVRASKIMGIFGKSMRDLRSGVMVSGPGHQSRVPCGKRTCAVLDVHADTIHVTADLDAQSVVVVGVVVAKSFNYSASGRGFVLSRRSHAAARIDGTGAAAYGQGLSAAGEAGFAVNSGASIGIGVLPCYSGHGEGIGRATFRVGNRVTALGCKTRPLGVGYANSSTSYGVKSSAVAVGGAQMQLFVMRVGP